MEDIASLLYDILVALVWLLLIVVACVMPIAWAFKLPLLIFIFVVGFVSLAIDARNPKP